MLAIQQLCLSFIHHRPTLTRWCSFPTMIRVRSIWVLLGFVSTLGLAHADSTPNTVALARPSGSTTAEHAFHVFVKLDTRTDIAPSVKAHVLDEYEVLLPWPLKVQSGPVPFDIELKFKNISSNVTEVRDTRKGCAPPEVRGDFKHFEITRATLTGSLINIEGRRTTPDTRIARPDHDCTTLGSVSPGTTNIEYVAAFLPPQIIAGTPLKEPVVSHGIGTGGAWSFVYSPQ